MDANKRSDKAVDKFLNGYLCSQAVLDAFAEDLGMDAATAAKLATPFGAGTARNGELCGAVAGALIALGLAEASPDPTDQDARDRLFERVNEFRRRFLDVHGSISCRQLLGYNIGDPREHDLAVQQEVFTSKCPLYVSAAIEILDDMLTSGK